MARNSNTDKTSADNGSGLVFEEAPEFAPRGGGRTSAENIFSSPLRETYETQVPKQVAVPRNDADNCRTLLHRAAKELGIGADVRIVNHPADADKVYVQFKGRERRQSGAVTVNA